MDIGSVQDWVVSVLAGAIGGVLSFTAITFIKSLWRPNVFVRLNKNEGGALFAPKGNHDIVFELIIGNKGRKDTKILSAEYFMESMDKPKSIDALKNIELPANPSCPKTLKWPMKISGDRVERRLVWLKIRGVNPDWERKLYDEDLELISKEINKRFSS